MATNSGESKIKQDLQANLKIDDAGSIAEMLAKVKQLTTQVNTLSKAMEKVMGSPSATNGFAAQLKEITGQMQLMKNQMTELGRSTATQGYEKNTLLPGAAAAGHLQGLKEISKAEEALYKERVLKGRIHLDTLLKETDVRKQNLALETLALKAETAKAASVRKKAAEDLAALQKEYAAKKQAVKDNLAWEAELRATKEKTRKADQRELNRLHGLAIQEDKKRTEYAKSVGGLLDDVDKKRHDANAKRRFDEAQARAGEREARRAVGTGRALSEGFQDLRQTQTVLRQKASIVDVARASNEKLIPTLANVAKATDLVWLQEEKRYAGIRKGLGGEDVKKEEQARINAIRARIKELEKEEKQTNISTAALHAQNAAAGRLRMSQHTLGTITPLLPTMTDHDLRSLTQGQRARDLAGQGMGTARGDGISKDAQAALDAIKKEQDARKEAANKRIADDKRVAAEKKKLIEDGAKVELDADAKKRRNTKGTVDEIKATRDLADEKRKHSVAEATRIADIAKNNKVTVDGIKEIKHLHDINDQLAASRHRQRATQSQAEKKAEVDLQQLLRLRAQELNKLHRQDKTVESDADRAARLDMARRNTRERLFGDGGANTMIVQAGLMANYQVLGGLQSLLSGAASSAIEFDKALKQVQAVSAATRNEMVDLRQSLIEVAQSSRFSAAEVAQASVLLAQAGLSVKEIQQTMAATISLATASGSELKKSVDVMTSVLSVFDMGADKSTDVANKLTAALNMSKLDIDKMALGLQYAGNAAADAGVTFDELVSTLSAMANAGIRSGSTLGTGTRQLFVELQKPSENFKRVLDRLGIGMSQIDIKAQGFEGVLRNLQEAGFTTGDAFQSFQIRAASSFAALSNNIGVFHDMQDAIEGTNAAMEANEIQMESLAVQYDHLKSNLGIVAAEGFAPVLAATRDTVKMFAHFFEGAEKGSASLKVAFTALTGVVLVAASAMSLNMVAGLVKLGGGIRSLLVVTQLGTLALAKFAAGARVAGTALALLSFTPIILGIGLIAAAFISFGKESDKLKDKLDEARTKMNGFAEANNKSAQTIENVDEAINTLATRYGRLSENSQELDGYVKELANQFKAQGLTIENLAGKSIEQLIETLGRLRTELSDDYIINIREEGDAQEKALKLESERKLALAREKSSLLGGVPLNRSLNPKGQTAAEAMAKGPLVQMTPEEQLRGVVKAIAEAGTDLAREQALKKFGFKDEGAVNKQLSGILANPKILPNQSRYFGELENILGLNQAGRGVEGRIETVRKNKEVAIAREKLTAAAHLDENSGYQITTRMRSALSVENKNNPKTGASLDYLETNNKLVEAKLDEIKAQRELIKNSVNVQDMAKYQALGDEATELAKMKSTYEQQMAPLVLERNKLKKDLAKYELEDAEAEVKRLEDLISNENNAGKVRGELADSLAAAQRNVGKKKVDLLVATMDAEKASDARKAAAVAREQAAIRKQLDKTTTVIRERSEAIIKAEESLQQDRGQDALKKPFTDLGKRLDDFDTNLKGLLDDRSSSVSAKVRQLKQRIQDNRLAGAGIATSGDLYGPKALGRNNDLADLSFRRRAGAQFRSAALGKELQKAQVEEAKLKVSAIDQELPKLLAIQDDHKKELDRLAASRDEARQGYIAKDTEYDRRVKAGEAIPDNFMAERKLAYETYKEANALYDSEEKQANNIKDKIYGLEDTKNNLLDTLGNQEGKFGMWLDAMRTGVEGLTQSFSDMFQRIVTGTGDTEEAFREMGRGILASMLKVISDKIAQKFMEIVGGFIGDMIMPSPAGTAASPEVAGMTATATFGPGSRTGGPIHRRAGGGYVPGSVARDAVPTLLMPGEFVLQKSASAALGEDFLHGLNRTTGATMRQGAERAAKAATPAAPGEPSSVNVWVVTPDQQTGMSKDDIIVTVGDNIARNGSIRKLIKQVQVGG